MLQSGTALQTFFKTARYRAILLQEDKHFKIVQRYKTVRFSPTHNMNTM